MNSQPVALLGVPDKQVIQWPSLAVRSDTVFVAGNVFEGESLTVRPAYFGRLRVDPLGKLVPLAPLELPAGDFQFAYPRVIPAGGTLHLVWAEFGVRPRSHIAWLQASLLRKSLWHSTLVNGAWSAPEQITSGEFLGWTEETGSIAVDAGGTLHVALWKADVDSMPRVHDFRLVGGRWVSSSVPYTGLNPAAAIVTRGDTVLLAFVAEAQEMTRVMVLESVDHGKAWTHPIVASSRPRMQGAVSRLAFASTANGVLLAIGEKPSNSFYLDTIRVLRLEGSRRISNTRFVPPPPAADQFLLASTSCGSVVMLTRNLSTTPQIFQITIPSDVSRAVSGQPLLDRAGFSAFPGIIANGQSPIAVFAYNPMAGTPGHSVAMPLRACSA